MLTRGEKDQGGGWGGEISQSRLGCPKLRKAVARLYPCVRSFTNTGGAVIHSECRILEKTHSALFHSPQRSMKAWLYLVKKCIT